MTNKKAPKQRENQFDFDDAHFAGDFDDADFSDHLDDCDHDHLDEFAMNDMFENLVQASNHQVVSAIELTKLIAEKNTDMTQEKILEAFKQSIQTVSEHFPLKALWEKLS